MSSFDFNAYQQISNTPINKVKEAVDKAIEKAHMGTFLVCITLADEVLVLPEFSVLMRDDISEVVYESDKGYRFSSNQGESKWN